ncbi:MAG: SMC-Scp complex subunit ScpB [Candidatus Harrisonbacteria bacterium]|nr:SMC-Scp complex subunit ScpB [Candidatus Harrisonbacteria bacterium]
MNKNLSAKLEAFLFIYGEPLEIKKIAKLLKTSEEEIRKTIKSLGEELTNEQRGLFLTEHENKVQLTTKPDFSKLLEDVVKEEVHENLTPAALETLSIIAYAGPLSRAEIEYIRGVNSNFTLRNLLIRGLINRNPDPKRGNVYLYQSSVDLLRHLGITKSEDLPEFERFQKLIEKLRNPENQNAGNESK